VGRIVRKTIELGAPVSDCGWLFSGSLEIGDGDACIADVMGALEDGKLYKGHELLVNFRKLTKTILGW